MNRRERRAQKKTTSGPKNLPKELTQALSSLESLQELTGLVERLKPYTDNVEQLGAALDSANEALEKAQSENAELKASFDIQRQVYLRMFATGMDIPLEDVLTMEAQIREKLDADTTTRAGEDSPENEAQETSSSPDTSGGLETASTEGHQAGRIDPGP